ncbi:MAG: hypothetical protein LBL69_00475, partial [Zoogloeaceae bacterium]|nr:hypothetical protein [Zoogloeaceae bacterium]
TLSFCVATGSVVKVSEGALPAAEMPEMPFMMFSPPRFFRQPGRLFEVNLSCPGVSRRPERTGWRD